ncbi:MAG: YlmC/YmxH family sporulation protein [Clostridia bacterium]|nr:YlmC/YmxH family sporulation protein [Clostridia bacterium]
MSCRIGDLRNKQVVCVRNGCVLGFVSDVEINTSDGRLEAIVIFGRSRLLGVLGRDDDIVIPWSEIEVIGQETVLVATDPAPFIRLSKRNRYTM